MTRIATGVGLVLLGTMLLVLPGPGILTIAAGLAILATEFSWARSLLDWVKGKSAGYLTGSGPSASFDGDFDPTASKEGDVPPAEERVHHEGG